MPAAACPWLPRGLCPRTEGLPPWVVQAAILTGPCQRQLRGPGSSEALQWASL